MTQIIKLRTEISNNSFLIKNKNKKLLKTNTILQFKFN